MEQEKDQSLPEVYVLSFFKEDFASDKQYGIPLDPPAPLADEKEDEEGYEHESLEDDDEEEEEEEDDEQETLPTTEKE